MIRPIKQIHRSPIDGIWYILECDHVVKRSEEIPVIMPGSTCQVGVFCITCDSANELPNDVKEIWKDYWHNRRPAHH